MNFKLISLGCPKNLVDAEYLAGRLEEAGYVMSDEADLVVINTCGFIEDAVRESIETILEAAKAGDDRRGPSKRIVVTGCLVERYKEALSELLPEVDLFVGRGMYGRIASVIGQSGFRVTDEPFADTFPRKTLTPLPTAYLKIQEGCSNRCTYCTVPLIRGDLVSRRPADVAGEFRWLLGQGYREITVIGQDITSFGNDGGGSLVTLLEDLLREKGDYFLRLLYLHPKGVTDELLHLIAGDERIIPYLDLPIQHSESPVLKAMNRRYDRVYLEDLLGRVRTIIPHATLRTSIIVGFPGESEKDFDNLCAFVDHWKFDNLGAFLYSKEEGTEAYGMKKQVTKGVKQERYRRLMEMQNRISKENLKRLVGTTTKVIVETKGRGYTEGRILAQAPDIDGVAFIRGTCAPGEVRECKIVKTLEYDVIVEVSS